MNLVNQKVHHKTFGKGTVLSFNGSYLLVDSPSAEKNSYIPMLLTDFFPPRTTELPLKSGTI
jgi:hypothetical protein